MNVLRTGAGDIGDLAGAGGADPFELLPDRARTAATEALCIARDEGFTANVMYCAFVAAQLAARRHDVEATAVILDVADQHARPLGIVGNHLNRLCRGEAQAFVDAANLTGARRPAAIMAIDDFINYPLEVLAVSG